MVRFFQLPLSTLIASPILVFRSDILSPTLVIFNFCSDYNPLFMPVSFYETTIFVAFAVARGRIGNNVNTIMIKIILQLAIKQSPLI